MYAVTPRLTGRECWVQTHIITFNTLSEALNHADALTDESGEAHTVLEIIVHTEDAPPEPGWEPEDYNKIFGLTPGADYPFTL